MGSFVITLTLLTFFILLLSTLIFESIKRFSLFSDYKYAYIFGSPLINFVVLSVGILVLRNYIFQAIAKVNLKNINI
jgi:hypothetical protein